MVALDILDHQLWRLDTAILVDIQTVDHAGPPAAIRQGIGIEGNGIDAAVTRGWLQVHLEMALPHRAAAQHIEFPLKYRCRKPLPPRAGIA